MSTPHLEDDPPPNLPMIKAPPPEPPTHDSEIHRSIIPDGGDGVEEDGFRTPTSIESRIPPVLTCPPAPRKPRPSQKRTRAVLENETTLEKIPRAEIEALFRSFEEFGAVVVFRAATKRRCLCK